MSFIVAILAASLVGSVHCAAMCGGFVCVYSGGCGQSDSRTAAHAAYNGARLAAYLMLGMLAGTVGAGIDQAGVLVGIGRAAAILAGTMMVFWGGREILRAFGIGPRLRGGGTSGAGIVSSWIRRALARVLGDGHQSAVKRAGAIGFLTALLPCGWLYAFVASAATTGNPLGGALVMLAFWAGTVPMLLAVAMGAHRAFGAVRRRMPLVGAAVLMGLGLLSIAGRVRAPTMQRAAVSHAHH